MQQDYSQDEREISEDAIDRLRNNPIHWGNMLMVLANVIIFALVELTGSSLDTAHMIRWGAASTNLIHGGEYYRLFTCMFLHFGLEHLFNNMLMLLFIGDYLEQLVGKVKYLLIYLLGGMIASFVSYWHNLAAGVDVVSAGASGAVFAVVGALLYILIRNKGQIENLSLKRMFLMAALSLYVGFSTAGIDNFAHLGGFAGGFILAVLLYRKKTGSDIMNSAP